MSKLFRKFYFLFLIFIPTNLQSLIRGVWIPYWKSSDSIYSAEKNLNYIDQISPFSYEINKNGDLVDKFKKNKDEWDELFYECRQKGIKIIPTIFWSNKKGSSFFLLNKKDQERHINQIITTILQNEFDGININYEKLNYNDIERFLSFMKELSIRLHELKLLLFCTISGNVSDSDLKFNLSKTALNSDSSDTINISSNKDVVLKNYKSGLSKFCDYIVVMGYDEWGTPWKYNKNNLKNQYYVSHASNQWVDKIIEHTLSFIPAKKLILGVPTYGSEFKVDILKNDINFKKIRNLNLSNAMKLASDENVVPNRTAGGELAFTYKIGNELRYVCFIDNSAIQDKIRIAEKYKIGGIYIFRLDNLENDKFWSVMKPE